MYNSICRAVKEKIVTNSNFSTVIPTGTMIQNMRTTYLGDTLTRDGFHLSFDLGRYFASLIWFHKLTDLSIDSIKFKPIGVTEKDLLLAKKAVKLSVNNPYHICEVK